MTITIYIIEDHPLMCTAIGKLVELTPDIAIAGMAHSGEEALLQLPSINTDLILVDIALPHMSGIEVISAVHKQWPQMPLLAFSGHQEANYVRRALDAGASGFVAKGDPYELVKAIRQIWSGHSYLSDIAQKELDRFC
jgi:two-component system invasion response regulator UvrY